MSLTSSDQNQYALNIDEIRNFLPHRYPMLLVDRVLSIEPKGDLKKLEGSEDKVGAKIVSIKNITATEHFFQGHFPERSIFPGVLTIEAMAQSATLVIYPYCKAQGEELDLAVALVGVDDARFRRPIVPGDTLRFEVVLTKCRSSLWQFDAKVFVEGKVAAEAILLASMNITRRKK